VSAPARAYPSASLPRARGGGRVGGMWRIPWGALTRGRLAPEGTLKLHINGDVEEVPDLLAEVRHALGSRLDTHLDGLAAQANDHDRLHWRGWRWRQLRLPVRETRVAETAATFLLLRKAGRQGKRTGALRQEDGTDKLRMPVTTVTATSIAPPKDNPRITCDLLRSM
jgi:hypothetical protein